VRDVGARDSIVVELSFLTGVLSQSFTVQDPRVTASEQVVMWQSGQAPTGKSQDENELDAFSCRCASGAGSFVAYIDSLFGVVAGPFRFAYVVR